MTKEVYKMRWMQRNLSSPNGVDWYEDTSGARVYHDLDELVEHCKKVNVSNKGVVIYWVGGHEGVPGTKPNKKGEYSYSAGKMIREIRPTEFDGPICSVVGCDCGCHEVMPEPLTKCEEGV